MICGLFCLVTVARYLWISFGSGSWGPRFVCVEPTFDFGEVETGGAIQHEFMIRNTGRQPLHILRATAGCGSCLTAKVIADQIRPGGMGIVRVVLDTSKLDRGPVKKTVLLGTDDPQLKKVVLYVTGTAHSRLADNFACRGTVP